jgi:signal transduction histidine kinase
MNSPHATSLTHNAAGTGVDMHWAFEQSPDCIKIMACTGELQAMNVNGQCAMEIDDMAAVLGLPWHRLWPDAAHEQVQAAIDAACAGMQAHFNAYCPTAKGTPRWWDVVVTPIHDGDGAVRSLLAVSRDVTDLHRAVHEADRKKDEFLAMLAHELRNPLAPICAAAQVITDGRADAAQQARAGAIIERQAHHMRHLLDDLLDVARVTQGLVALDMAPVDMADVVTHALEQARPIVAQYRHHLGVTLAPGRVLVSGDSQRLVQVVANLLNNAAKYTPAGGSVALALTVSHGCARISVSDNGIGMAPSTLQNAFELFSQAARSSDRASGGLGLGLALVKGLVERHGGSVTGRSDGPNCGSEFVVLLPLLPAQAPAPAVPSPADSGIAPGRLRLLIVDDNRDAAETLAMYLDMLGHETHVAFSGREGLEQAARLTLDACLLDVGLPDMTGHELARRLAAIPAMQGAVLIAVTGYGSASDRAESAEAGFHHHLTKPVDTHVLELLLDAVGVAA